MTARKLDSQERDLFYCDALWDWEYSHDILISLWFEEEKEEIADDTVDAWKYCVKRLKQQKEEETIYVHCFKEQEEFVKKLFWVNSEQEQDRIDNLYKELSSDADIWHIEGNLFPRMTNAFFRQAIEKHMPKRLCRIIKRGDLQGKEFDYIIIDENVTEEQIKELQAGDWKEKEEEDWIDNLFDKFTCFDWPDMSFSKETIDNYRKLFRQVIEDNMPKQKKLTIDEVVYMFWWNLTVNNRYIQEKKERAICFLRARGLLEE